MANCIVKSNVYGCSFLFVFLFFLSIEGVASRGPALPIFLRNKFNAVNQLSAETSRRFQSRGFGLYSYYDTLTDAADTQALIQFCNAHNISFINQYACAAYSPSQFSNFVQNIGTHTNAKVRVLFDDTLSLTPGSKCANECARGASTGKGWCCGSVDFKLSWLRKVLDSVPDSSILDGANFDIEGLTEADYLDLFRTMRGFWNDTISSKYSLPNLRFNFGNNQQALLSTALQENDLDGVYWEAYESSSAPMLESAASVLAAVKGMVSRRTGSVLLAFETNCCAQPCVSYLCTSCGTHPLPDRDSKSFGICQSNQGKREDRILHLLEVLDSVEDGLKNMGLWKFVDQRVATGFVAYNYRGLHILLNGTDAPSSRCPKPVA